MTPIFFRWLKEWSGVIGIVLSGYAIWTANNPQTIDEIPLPILIEGVFPVKIGSNILVRLDNPTPVPVDVVGAKVLAYGNNGIFVGVSDLELPRKTVDPMTKIVGKFPAFRASIMPKTYVVCIDAAHKGGLPPFSYNKLAFTDSRGNGDYQTSSPSELQELGGFIDCGRTS